MYYRVLSRYLQKVTRLACHVFQTLLHVTASYYLSDVQRPSLYKLTFYIQYFGSICYQSALPNR